MSTKFEDLNKISSVPTPTVGRSAQIATRALQIILTAVYI